MGDGQTAAMTTSTLDPGSTSSAVGRPRLLAWPRLRFTLLVALAFGLLHDTSTTPALVWILRTVVVALLALLAYGVRSGTDLHAIMGDPARRNGFYSLLGPGLVFARRGSPSGRWCGSATRWPGTRR